MLRNAFAALVLLAGCGAQNVAVPLSPGALEGLRKDVDGRTGTVAYAEPATPPSPTVPSPASTRTGKLQIDQDVVRVLDGEQTSRIPFERVRTIDTPSAGAGAAAGVVTGLVLAVAAAGLWTLSDDPRCDERKMFCYGAGTRFKTRAMFLALPGVILGGLLGSAIGGTSTVNFVPGPSR
jgi:hypothetical protein